MAGKGANLRAVPVPPQPQGADDPLAFLPQPGPAATPFQPGIGNADDLGFDLPDQKPAIEKTYTDVSQADPQRAAEVFHYSGRLNEPEAFVDKNLDHIKKADSTPSPSFFTELETQYPGSTKFLSNPKNMAVTHDDLPNIAQHEALVNGVREAHSYWEDAVAGYQNSVIGLAKRGQLPDLTLPENAGILESLAHQVGTLAFDLPVMAAGGFAGAPLGPLGSSAGAFALPAMLREEFIQQYKNGDVKDLGDLLERTKHILTEGAKQSVVGLATGVGGMIGGKLAAPFASPLLKSVLPLATEVGAMTTAGKAVEGQMPTGRDFAEGLLMVGGMHAAGHIAGTPTRIMQERKVQESKNFYTALGDTAEASKLRERMPEAHQELIASLTKDGPVENVYIPHEALEQYFTSKGIEPAAAAEELGVTKLYQDAKQTGQDIKIPLADWVSKVVGTEHYKGLADDIKFSPDDLTNREMHERRAEVEAEIKDAASKAQAEAPADNNSTGVIADGIQKQLKAAGLSSIETRLDPKLHEAFFKSLGERMGVDPNELAQRFPLTINAEGTEGSTRLEQPARAVTFPVKQSPEGVFSVNPGEGLNAAGRIVDGKMQIDGLNFDKKYSGVGQDMIRSLEKTAVAGGAFSMEANARSPRERAAYEAQGFEVQSESKDGAVMFKDLSKEKVFNQKSRGDWKSEGYEIQKHGAPVDFEGADDGQAEAFLKDNPKLRPKDFNVYDPDGENVGSLRVGLTKDLKNIYVWDVNIDEAHRRKGIATALYRAAEKDFKKKLVAGVSGLSEDSKGLWSQPNRPFGADAKMQKYLQVDQGDSSAPRGQISFGKDRKFNIDLLKNADKSTFLHETGHYFLEVMGDLAAEGKSPEHIGRDYQTILDWLGVKDRSEIKTEQHEKFARGFEAYLREGKAPSEGLKAAFEKFKTWLTHIYRQLSDLNVELTPEVRGVMDRMLASENEINRARQDVGYDSKPIEGIPPELQSRIRGMQEKARATAEASLLKTQMAELNSKHEKFLREELSKQTKIAEEQVKQLPLYSAIEDLKKYPGAKKDQLAFAEKFLKGKLKESDAAHMEMLAEVHNAPDELRTFADGEDLARQIIESIKRDGFSKEVQLRTDLAMAPHADLRNTDKIREEAIKAIHGEKMTELLALEHQALQGLIENAEVRGEVSKRKRIEALADAKAAKAQAAQILSDKPIKDASRAGIYITAERKAAEKVAKALSKKDYAKAVEAKRQQMLNHALVAEALRNKTEAEKNLKFLSKFEKRGKDLLNLPYGFASQIDQMLSRHDLAEPRPVDDGTMRAIALDMISKGEPADEIANATGLVQDNNGAWVPEKLNQFVDRVNDNYYALTVEDSVLQEAPKNYEDLTMGELRALKDATQAISEIGKKYTHFLDEFQTIDVKTAAKAFRTSVEANVGNSYAESFAIGSKNKSAFMDKIDSILNFPDAMIPDLVNVLTLTHFLDGGKEDGPAKQFIYRPLKMAEDRKIARYEGMTEKVNKLLSDHFTPKELSDYKEKREFIEAVGRHMTREEILSMGLNWGNEGNRDRIRKGYNLNDAQVNEIIGRLNKKEWDFIQGTWDHLETYWPDIVKLEMKVRGVEPKSVEASPVTTAHGEYAGGYFPIAYDFEKSADAYKNAEQKNALYKQFSATAAHTDTGHTAERVSSVSRPVRLSLDTLFNHLENVVHDLEYRSAVIDVNRFLKQGDVKAALENAIGIKGANSIGEWLKAAASDQGEHLNMADKALRWFRFKATFATLGYRLITFPIDVTGNTLNGVWEIGPQRMASAIKEFAMNPGDTKELVHAKSERMRFRATMRDRDINEMAKKWRGQDSVIAKYGFLVQSIADEAVSIPLWNEVYKRAVSEHGEQKAINIADETVTRTVGSGSTLDQVAAQRGSETKKIFSMYYSYMSMMFNRCWLDGKLAGLEYDKGNVGGALAIMAKATFFAWAMQSLNENLWKEFFRNNKQDDKNSKFQRVVGRTLSQPFSYVWIVRDIMPPVIEKALGQKNANYQMSPVASAAQTILSTAGEAGHLAFTSNSHADKHFGENAAKSAAYLLGYPQTLNTLTFNFLDWAQNNGEASWRDAISRRTQK